MSDFHVCCPLKSVLPKRIRIVQFIIGIKLCGKSRGIMTNITNAVSSEIFELAVVKDCN